MVDIKKEKRYGRRLRIRKKITGTEQKPRLSVFRSNKYIYAQLIDDAKGITLVAVNEKGLTEVKGKTHAVRGAAAEKKNRLTKIERASALGQALAQKAKEKNIQAIVFDRGGYRYHGRVKALADAAREAGLQF